MSSLPSGDARGALGQALAWWTGELASLVPPGLARRLAGPAPDMVIVLRDGSLALAADTDGDAETRERAVWAALDHARRRGRPLRIALRVPQRACFARRLEMPQAVRRDLARMLALDLERATPFKPADIYWAHYAEPGRTASGALAVHQLILRKDTVAAAIESLEAAGDTVVSLECLADDGRTVLPVDFLAAHEADQSVATASRGRTVAALAAGIAALALSALWLDTTRHEAALADLAEQTAALRARVADAERLGAQGTAAQADVAALLAMKAERTPAVEILDELTRLVPDEAWLSELRIARGALDLAGFAKPAAALVPLLERSDLFAAATLTAPVTLDPDTDKERFSLNVRMRGPEGEEPAADAEPEPADDEAAP